MPILAMLAALAPSAYRLLPLSAREVLLAKDIAYLMVLAPLIIPLNAAAGFAFGLASLAVGHHSSVTMRLP